MYDMMKWQPAVQADKAKDAKGGKTEAKEPAKEPAKEDPKAKLPGNPLGTTSDFFRHSC